MKTFFLRTSILLLVSSTSLLAQDYAVSPLSNFLDSYKQKHQDIAQKLEISDLPFAQKLAFYENKISELKEDFKTSRKSEYENKSVKRAKRHACKGTRIRGVTDCEAVYIKAPNNKMYTKEDWVKVEGADKMIAKVVDNSSVGIKLTATGTRVNKAVVYTTFKYKPDLIKSIVNNETNDLFNQIIER